MLYSEFVAGTGCKDNDKNYEVYKNLEIMYMNSNMSKAEIYEYGKKLVDNSKSEEELRVEAEIKAEMEEVKAEIEERKMWIEQNEEYIQSWKEYSDKEMVTFYQNNKKFWKREIKELRNKLAALKWVLA